MRVRRAAVAAAAGALLVSTGLVAGQSAGAAPQTAADDPVTHDENPRVPEGAAWTEAYFPSADGSGVELHADVLRPAHLPPNAETPVILSVGPYFSHAGQTGDEGFDQTGPSARFNDFVEGADLFENGYTFVMVDLRGFGGSTGCLDWVGPGEQADVRAAIDWSASQPWSDGNVGMYGKSYDAVTGLVGNNLRMRSLKAVVAQEPLWDMYYYLYSNKVPRPNVTGTPNAYNSIATIDPLPDDDSRYQANARYEEAHPECLTENLENNQEPDPKADYWKDRDLAAQARGTRTPLFVTQGFIEPNTKPEDMEQFLDNHRGPERGWLGQWEHVRGNDTYPDGRLAMGRAGWFDEVMRFYDQYLKGIEPTVEDPAFAIEDNLGEWRAQRTWPEVDRSVVRHLRTGRYVDDGGASTFRAEPDGSWDMENAPRFDTDAATTRSRLHQLPDPESSYLTWSVPVRRDVRITGTPRVGLTASATGNVMVRLWDVDRDGNAVMFDENVALIERRGRVAFDLKSTDWTLQRGHRLAVQIGTIGAGSWRDVPSGNTIWAVAPRLSLDLQDPSHDVPTQGDRSPYLDAYLSFYTTTFEEVGRGTFSLTTGRHL